MLIYRTTINKIIGLKNKCWRTATAAKKKLIDFKPTDFKKAHLNGYWEFKRGLPREEAHTKIIPYYATALGVDTYQTLRHIELSFNWLARKLATLLNPQLTSHLRSSTMVIADLESSLEALGHWFRTDLQEVLGGIQLLQRLFSQDNYAASPESQIIRKQIATLDNSANRIKEHLLLLEGIVGFLSKGRNDIDDIRLIVQQINELLEHKNQPLVRLLNEIVTGFISAGDEKQVYELLAKAFHRIFQVSTLRLYARRINEAGLAQKSLILERSNDSRIDPSPAQGHWVDIEPGSGSALLATAEGSTYIYSYEAHQPDDFKKLKERYPNVPPEKFKLVFYKLVDNDPAKPFAEMWERYLEDFSEEDLHLKKLLVKMAATIITRLRSQDKLAKLSKNYQLFFFRGIHAEAFPKITAISGYIELVLRNFLNGDKGLKHLLADIQVQLGAATAPEQRAFLAQVNEIILKIEETEKFLGRSHKIANDLTGQLRKRIIEAKNNTLEISARPQKVDLQALIEEIIAKRRHLLFSKQGLPVAVNILVRPDGEKVYANTDLELATEVLEELITNAVKYLTKPKLSITVEKKELPYIEISVRNPVKFSAKKLDDINQGFYYQNNESSSGVGLPFTRLIVKEYLKGTFDLSLEEEEFVASFTLPLHPDSV
ncbi:MAG: hypothetical protein PHH14_04085 [Candidatus Margulisbacteria bacterium]|nr:hypothetical protein [Candidatus Margulisiibacteriota bacterium]